ncbi:MAG: alpha/beta hydrolase [Acetobacteraceae bacterium]|nr:alpha/beta hydrolase [Acetobacteraceae bacterium]
MTDHSRWDPEMRAARQRLDAEAAKYPPVAACEPFDVAREVTERLGQVFGSGGPAMALTEDQWVYARGRRVFTRFHHPAPGERRPLLIWFHGGGWVWSSVDTHDRLVRELATASGYAALNVDYSLSPEAKFPTALLECAEVVRAVADTAEEWNIDASRIVLGGDSAGGNLAIATAIALRDHGGPALAGMHLVYPVADANFDTNSYREFAEGHGLTRAAMQTYWNLYTRDPADRLNPLAAPLRDHLRALPPALVQLAELDVLHSEGNLLAGKLNIVGSRAAVITYPGMLHGFMRLTESVAQAREAVAHAAEWLKEVGGMLPQEE